MINKERKVEDLLADDSFIRWIEGTASASETDFWKNWKDGGSIRHRKIEEARELHYKLRFEIKQRDDLGHELITLNQALDNHIANKKMRPLYSINRKSSRVAVWYAAAVFLICIMVSGIVYFLVSAGGIESEFADVRSEIIETEYGETKQISLPNGSVIVLNANSVITYSLSSGGSVMEAELDGEAWFEIPPTANGRVSVHTADGSVHVLGTMFNVNTYRGGTSVVLEEGSIHVEMKNSLGEISDEVILTPGMMAQVGAGESAIYTSSVDPDLHTSWTRNRLRFDDSPFTEVEKRVKDIYGLEFLVADASDSLLDIKISGSVPNNNIDVLLNALEGLLGKSASIQGTMIVLE